MPKPNKILCVCFENNDRSPVMASVLNMYLKSAGHNAVVCESAGINNDAQGDGAAPFSMVAARRLGLELRGHKKKNVREFDLTQYDLIIVVDDIVAGVLVDKHAVSANKIFNAQIANAWPCQFQEQFDATMESIMIMMYRIIKLYFA